MNRGKLAAAIHRRMVDDDRFGYSWAERWGATTETWTVDGVTFPMKVGDYDCSSSTITAWRKALTGTPWADALDAATFTGNMRSVFVASGLFEWKPMTFIAEPGDLYLDEANHVAMCQSQSPDLMSEFSISETGGTTGKRGDQTGREAAVNPYRSFADGILHYNHKADGPAETDEEAPMTFLFEPDGRKEVWFYDGGHVVRLTNLDHMKAIQSAYKLATGEEIPYFKFGDKKSPWAARFAQCFDNRAARNGRLTDEYRMNGWTV